MLTCSPASLLAFLHFFRTFRYPCARKENEMALQQADMRMVRWMCDIKVKYKVPSKELREKLRRDDGMVVCCKKKPTIG